MSILFKMHFYT